MEEVGTGLNDGMLLAMAGALSLLALLWAWMAGRMGWHWFISALVILSGLVLLVAVSVVASVSAELFLYQPAGDMTHAGGVALMMIAINAGVAAVVWLAVLIGLRRVGARQRRKAAHA